MVACDSQCRPELAGRTAWRRRMSLWSGEGPSIMTVIAPWRDLAAAASSPVWRQPDLALDGYLTGVIIAPRPIPTAYWQGAILAGDDVLLRDEGHARVTRDTLVSRHAALVGDIDQHLARLERDRACDYRPAFWPGEGAPSHTMIRRWAGGFSAARRGTRGLGSSHRSGCHGRPTRFHGSSASCEAPIRRWLCHTGRVGFRQDRAERAARVAHACCPPSPSAPIRMLYTWADDRIYPRT